MHLREVILVSLPERADLVVTIFFAGAPGEACDTETNAWHRHVQVEEAAVAALSCWNAPRQAVEAGQGVAAGEGCRGLDCEIPCQ